MADTGAMGTPPLLGGLAASSVLLADGRRAIIRPIRADDWPELQRLHARLSPRSRRFRFLSVLRELPEPMARRFADVDFDEQAAFVAVVPGEVAIRGVARYARRPGDPFRGEMAVVVEDAFQGVGLGRALLERLIAFARDRGVVELGGSVLPENGRMLALLRSFPYPLRERVVDGQIEFVLMVGPAAPQPSASARAKARWTRGRTA